MYNGQLRCMGDGCRPGHYYNGGSCTGNYTATSINYVNPKNHHSLKINDYCNSLYYNLPNWSRNLFARAIIKALKSYDITLILRSLHWLTIQHIEYKLLSLTYKVLTTIEPSYLYLLITF